MTLSKILAAAVCAPIVWTSLGAAQKKPTNTTYPAVVTFSDQAGDRITSDGGGPYVSGGQLSVAFTSQGNHLMLSGSNGSRYLFVDYTDRLTTTGPIGTIPEADIFMNIHNILDMAPGTFRQTSAAVRVHLNGYKFFRLNPTNFPGTTLVDVERHVDGTWIVTGGSDTVSALIEEKGRTQTVAGLYGMPFQLTATCASCPF